MSHRWMKFWPADWKGDPALRMCSLAARGLWIEMIALAHEAEPYGHVLVSGRAPTPRQLAAIVGGTERDVTRLLQELEEAGVFSRTEAGAIYSRRMVRDRHYAEQQRAFGKTGGNPALTDKPTLKGRDKAPLGEGDKFLEAEIQKQNTEPSVLPPVAPLDARAVLWSEGLARLRRVTGKPDGAARGLLGRFCKEAGDDCALVSSLLHEAERDRPGDPVAWISAAILSRTGRRGTSAPKRESNLAWMREGFGAPAPQPGFDLDLTAEEVP